MIKVENVPCDFEWSKKMSGYRWEDDSFASSSSDLPESYLLENIFGEYALWNPLIEKPYLFIEFAELKPDHEAFLQWANENGRLTKGRILEFVSEDAEILGKDLKFEAWWRPTEKGSLWDNAHFELSSVYKIWKFIEIEDKASLEKYFSWEINKQNIQTAFVYHPFGKKDKNEMRKDPDTNRLERVVDQKEKTTVCSDTDQYWKKIEMYYPDIKAPARYFVEDKIHKMLNRYPLNLNFSFEGINRTEEKKMQPSDLLSAMWLMFYLYIKGEIKIKRCDVCGKWESMEGHRSNWVRHPKCANIARVRKHREKNAEE